MISFNTKFELWTNVQQILSTEIGYESDFNGNSRLASILENLSKGCWMYLESCSQHTNTKTVIAITSTDNTSCCRVQTRIGQQSKLERNHVLLKSYIFISRASNLRLNYAIQWDTCQWHKPREIGLEHGTWSFLIIFCLFYENAIKTETNNPSALTAWTGRMITRQDLEQPIFIIDFTDTCSM